LSAIGEYWDNEGIVYFLPVEEIEASDGVAEEVDSPDSRLGAVCHDGDVVGPVKSVVKIYAEVLEGFDG
jgi:hypothetical protein